MKLNKICFEYYNRCIDKFANESLGKLFWKEPSKACGDESFIKQLQSDPTFVFKYINPSEIRQCIFNPGDVEGENILDFIKNIDGSIAKYLAIGLVKFALTNPTNYGNVKLLGDAIKMLRGKLLENNNLGKADELLNKLHFRIYGGGVPPEWEILSD
jgi:hypothetical protein